MSHIEILEPRRLMSLSPVSTAIATPASQSAAIISSTVTPIGVTIHAEATDRFSGVVGILKNFIPPPAPLITSPIIGVGLQASINWGDGTVSAGTLVAGTVPNE